MNQRHCALRLIVLLWMVAAALHCATLTASATPELQMGILPYSAPINDVTYTPETRAWHIHLLQQFANPPPRDGEPGYHLHSTAVELGLLHAFGRFTKPDQTNALWHRMAVDGHVVAGAIYGQDTHRRNQVGGVFGNLNVDFGLQLLSRPAGSLSQFCGVFGTGFDYTLVTISGPGPDADVATSFTYIEAGLQAAFQLGDNCLLQSFLMARGGMTGSAVHQSGRVHERVTGFYRIFPGADLAWRYDPIHPQNQIAAQATLAYADNARFALTCAITLRFGF